MIRRVLLASAGAMALTGAALAAEPAPPPPPPPYVPLPWTGFYIGGNAGYEWSTNVSVSSTGAPNIGDPTLAFETALIGVGTFNNLPVKNNGFIGGGQVGYNFEFPDHVIVAGMEGDIQGVAGASSSTTRAFVVPVTGFADSYTSAVRASNRLDFLGTLRVRVGYLFTPTFLTFGSVGFAYGGISSSTSIAAAAPGFPAVFDSVSLSTTDVGWSAGGGVEWMFLPHWSFKVEYLYYQLSKETSSFGFLTQTVAGVPFAAAVTSFTIRPQGNVVRAGINYLFTTEPPPVVSKY